MRYAPSSNNTKTMSIFKVGWITAMGCNGKEEFVTIPWKVRFATKPGPNPSTTIVFISGGGDGPCKKQAQTISQFWQEIEI
jgi:hypothetical protein